MFLEFDWRLLALTAVVAAIFTLISIYATYIAIFAKERKKSLWSVFMNFFVIWVYGNVAYFGADQASLNKFLSESDFAYIGAINGLHLHEYGIEKGGCEPGTTDCLGLLRVDQDKFYWYGSDYEHIWFQVGHWPTKTVVKMKEMEWVKQEK